MKKNKDYNKYNKGYILFQVLIAVIIAGMVAYNVVYKDILPGLKTKWEVQSRSISNDWLN